MYKGGNSNHTVPLIFATKACKLIEKVCNAYLCAVEAIETPGFRIFLYCKTFWKFSKRYQVYLLIEI